MRAARARTGSQEVAALVVAAALWIGALPNDPPPASACAHPRELRARGDHTTAATCDAPESDGGRGAVRGPARRLFGLAIDPNRADAATLESLPGIGPARAQAILRERERRPFLDLRDLARVRGIGPRTLAGLAGLAAVDPTPAEPVRCRCPGGRARTCGGKETHGQHGPACDGSRGTRAEVPGR